MGTRIAVIADPGDDISSLEIPPEETGKGEKSAKEEAKGTPEPSSISRSESEEPTSASKPKSKAKPPGQGQKQTYPLYPSVEVLLHQHNLKAEDIKASGPKGRLLKGDVLAHLDQIPSSYPAELTTRLTKLSHLDLSNIKPAPPKQAPVKKAAKSEEKQPDPPVSLSIPISLTAVLQVQKRMQDSLGISLPLSTFIARAIALANEDLPRFGKAPTADELFNAVLGLDKTHLPRSTQHGNYTPRIVAPSDPPSLSTSRASTKRGKKVDLFDEILGSSQARHRSSPAVREREQHAVAPVGSENVFSLSVDEAEAKRAKLFLVRVKTMLEADPGRLVL